MTGSKITAWGHYVPPTSVSNDEIEARLNLEPGWIYNRTGVAARRIATPNQAVSDLAINAGQDALAKGNLNQPVTTLILATSTPDHLLPPTAPLVAHALGLTDCAAMDLAVACSGFLYGLKLAKALVNSDGQSVMVIAANILSRRCKPNDVGTNAIFADAAGAVIVEPSNEEHILDVVLSSDGAGWEHLLIEDGGSRNPFSDESFKSQKHLMQINNGMAVFRYAVESMTKMGKQVLAKNELSVEEIDRWIPHQANIRIINSIQKNLAIDSRKTILTIERFGNSSAATIPVTISDAISLGTAKHGELCLLTAAAAGLTSGAAIIRL